ncbi:MAG: HAD-IA family hydrolase [Anaerolineae bacterium]
MALSGAREEHELTASRTSRLHYLFAQSRMQKPDPRIYALTCRRLALPPAEVIFLDDRQGAIDAALAAGIHGILFKDTAQAIHDIEACIRANA